MIPTHQQQHFKHLNDHTSSTHKASPTTATTRAMAQLPPEDVATEPTQKVVFNAPVRQVGHRLGGGAFGRGDQHRDEARYNFKTATRRAGSAFKTTKPKRINIIPPHGVLRPKKSVYVAITCDAFDPDNEDTEGDRVTVEWTNTPDSAATVFKQEWFQGDGIVRRKNLSIEYNV
ncbi:hypothetical protein niasHT_001426 [Heterodera trifolii]|uniref:Major sperm protein n=1 Tax=Heterodera trifolii TaxID=157864 RepID=A0ABD2LT76_9BILA